MPVLDVFDKPIADWDVVMKWTFDKIVGSLALIALSPVMAVTALAVKLSSKGMCIRDRSEPVRPGDTITVRERFF